MAQTLDHVSETLSLQRQYAREWVAHAAEPVNLIRLIEDAVAMQLGGFEKRGAKLRREYPSGPVLVEGDRTKLVRVLVNLFKNALESFDDPDCCSDIEPEIGIGVIVEGTDDGRRAVVTVSDNGAGFTQPPQSLTSDRKSTDKPGGSGMGLYAARRIVEAHGGTLSLSSDGAGMGVAARMSLPVAQEISK
jgi:signal transduction histidine kinase